MAGTILRRILLVATLLVAMLALGRPAIAQSPDAAQVRSSCSAAGGLTDNIASIISTESRWRCGKLEHSIKPERVFLRFDIDTSKPLPRFLFSRRAAHQAIHLVAVDNDGARRQISYAPSDLENSLDDGFFKAELPELTRQTRQLVVVVDLPSHRMILERAYLATTDVVDAPSHTRFMLILAALCGMLAMPIVFNAAFFRVLREPFVLWHSALTISLMLTILISSGLAPMLFGIPAMTLSWMATMVFGLTVASGAMFTHSFIEPGKMHPWLRAALPWCAGLAVCLSAFHAAFPFVARTVQSPIYTAAFAPILVVFLLALVDSLRRGSRAAKFQLVGWAPMVVVGLTRIVTGLFPALQINDAMLLFYIGCLCEVMSTALGVADRFMTLKRQRDHARGEAEALEYLSERDALTGLLNRRVLEQRFDEFRAQGFDLLAVLDLDHFKSINDVYGHLTGDAVLKATGEALQADSDVRAFRIGGEEFVLLARSDEAMTRAERRRQAIPAIVARSVHGLQRPVTASMGVVSLDGGHDGAIEFAAAYGQADRLLYEAKSSGRNRAVFAVEARSAAWDNQMRAIA